MVKPAPVVRSEFKGGGGGAEDLGGGLIGTERVRLCVGAEEAVVYQWVQPRC
jgi:hypothetical protein